MPDRIITALTAPTTRQPADEPNPCCPVCGDPYIGGPGCHAGACANPDREHEPLCYDHPAAPHDVECECWCHGNPHNDQEDQTDV